MVRFSALSPAGKMVYSSLWLFLLPLTLAGADLSSVHNDERLAANFHLRKRIVSNDKFADGTGVWCHHNIKVESGQTVTITSPTYPKYLDPLYSSKGFICVWRLSLDVFPGRQIKMECPSFRIPSSFFIQLKKKYRLFKGEKFETIYLEEGELPTWLVYVEDTDIRRNQGFLCHLTLQESKTYKAVTCGRSLYRSDYTERIIGGVKAKEMEFPWQAAIVLKNTAKVFCGGSLVCDRYILTAAHCIQRIIKSRIEYEILLGAHSLSQPNQYQKRFSGRRMVSHPDYDPETVNNDIGLIELETPINYETTPIRPVCLPSNNENVPLKQAIVTGWGRLGYGGNRPDVLQKAYVQIYKQSSCESISAYEIKDSMFCAGTHDGSRDTCTGDSGGPLQVEANDHFTIIGITSFGYKCGYPGLPGVYANVGMFVGWVKEELKDAKCYLS